uniref:Tudor domain-containing protein n=1 Tax=Heterorhabditis bacteriophora TaxID=37862 RepID=A0A1I7W5Z0_HETBA
MQDCFPHWLRLAYRNGKLYQPYDANMPMFIPRRPPLHYRDDPPLTEHGILTAEITGKGLLIAGLVPSVIYSSPELRCVQTAVSLVNALNTNNTLIRVEPGLAEWRQFFPENIADYWLTIQQVENDNSRREHFVMLKASGYRFLDFSTNNPNSDLKCSVVICFRTILVVSDSHVIEIVKNKKWSTAEELCKITRNGKRCNIHVIEIDEDRQIKTLKNAVLPFTKTLKDSIQQKKNASEE